VQEEGEGGGSETGEFKAQGGSNDGMESLMDLISGHGRGVSKEAREVENKLSKSKSTAVKTEQKVVTVKNDGVLVKVPAMTGDEKTNKK